MVFAAVHVFCVQMYVDYLVLVVSAVCVSDICMHDVCGGLVCMMCVGVLYAQCVWGTCMHQMCAVRLKISLFIFFKTLGEFRKCMLSLIALYIFFIFFHVFSL